MTSRMFSGSLSDSIQINNQSAKVDGLMVKLFSTTLNVVGESIAEDTVPYSLELAQNLKKLAVRLTSDQSNKEEAIKIGKQAELELREWGKRAAIDRKTIADQIKDLLRMLSQTLDNIDIHNQGYSKQLFELTNSFDKITSLSDLSMIQISLVAYLAKLNSCVDQMKRENQQTISELRTQLSSYESKLIRAEVEALKDSLTGLANRRSIEERLSRSIANEWDVCVAMLDLNQFKSVNDELGHLAGDDLLCQFAKRLSAQTRSGDLAGRWGGDEFVVILTWCDLSTAAAFIERIKKNVFGSYRLRTRTDLSLVDVTVNAAIGVAQWEKGDTVQNLLQKADSLMYLHKKEPE